MTDVEKLNQFIAYTGLLIGCFGLGRSLTGRYLERWIRRYFVSFFAVVAAYTLSNLLEQLSGTQTGPAWVLLRRISLFSESALAGVLMPLLTAFLLHCAGEPDWRHSPFFRAISCLWLVYSALLVYTWFSPVLYTLTTSNVYKRGPLYPLLLVPPLVILLMNLGLLRQKYARLTPNERITFSIFLLVPMISIAMQMLFYGVYAIVMGVTVSSLCMFLYILRDQTERYYRKEQENERLKRDIMLAQIQPHFLYNSLLVIQQVCLEDPKKASDAIGDFTRFLQHNMSSLDSDVPIPFAEELEHVQEYVRLQKIRFGSALEVEYDIACEDFDMPTLTLQPLVENAVKYGVRKNEDGHGRVTVSTREFPDRYEVRVSDNGPGFPPDADPDGTDRTHMGIRSVTDRLKCISGGTVTFCSEAGKGTCATIILPKEAPL